LFDFRTDEDIAAKARRYIQHPKNLYFLLLAQKQVRLEIRARSASWEPAVLETLDAVLELPEWSFRMPLAALYDGTPLAGTTLS
jgi:hypothetical protein